MNGGDMSQTQESLPDNVLASRGFNDLRLLGSGSYGLVYRAHHVATNATVAIKCVNTTKIFETATCDGERRVINPEDEIRTLALLNAEPSAATGSQPPSLSPLSADMRCLAKLIDSFSDGDWCCMVLEYCEGGDLRTVMHRKLAMGQEPTMRQLVRPLIQGLLYMKTKGVMHRDVKPENILLRKVWDPAVRGETTPDACLTDFGLSKVRNLQSQRTSFETVVGSGTYMSPERLRCERYDFEAESWAAAIIMFELYFGCLPYAPDETRSRELLDATQLSFKDPTAIFQHVQESMGDMSVPLMDLLSGMLHPDPKERMSLAEVACHEWWWWYEAEHEAAAAPFQKEKKLKCLVEQANALKKLGDTLKTKNYETAAALYAFGTTVLREAERSLKLSTAANHDTNAFVKVAKGVEEEMASMRKRCADPDAPIDKQWETVLVVVKDIHAQGVSGDTRFPPLGTFAVRASTALMCHLMEAPLDVRLEVGKLRRTMQRLLDARVVSA